MRNDALLAGNAPSLITVTLQDLTMTNLIVKPTDPRFKDLTGHTYGRLTVVSYIGGSVVNKNYNKYWKCKCSCGNEIVTTTSSLRGGHTASCGCTRIEANIKRNTTHGRSRTRDYEIWCHMISRCENPKASDYSRYGGRGIKIDRYFKSFSNFTKYMGPSNGFTLERINNNGNYAPGNVKWIMHEEQARNKRNNVIVIHNGIYMVLAIAFRESEKSRDTFYALRKKGYTPQEAFDLSPLRKHYRRRINGKLV